MPPFKASTQKAKNVTLVIHHAPKALILATAASGRLQKLLSLCDRQIEKLDTESNTDDTASNKEAKALIRLVLSLHKNLDHYTQILHPPTLSEVPPTLPVPTDILIRNLSRETAGESSAEGGGDYKCSKNENQTQSDNAELAAEKPIEDKVAAVIDSIAELSISAQKGPVVLPAKAEAAEMTTDAWEAGQTAHIEDSRQSILKDIETGKLTRRQGLEMIADMEWRFKGELQERHAAERNKESRNRWAG
jgi:hypothetical protein